MCGLCGILGGAEHWSDATALAGSSQAAPRQARFRRIKLLNRILHLYRLKADEWQGTMLLSGSTGRTELVQSLGDLWPKAEALAGQPIDPLDPELLKALEAASSRDAGPRHAG